MEMNNIEYTFAEWYAVRKYLQTFWQKISENILTTIFGKSVIVPYKV